MTKIILLITILSGIFLFLAFVWFAVVSYRENEPRAVRRAIILAVISPLLYMGAVFINSGIQFELSVILLSLTLLIPLILLFPSGSKFT